MSVIVKYHNYPSQFIAPYGERLDVEIDATTSAPTATSGTLTFTKDGISQGTRTFSLSNHKYTDYWYPDNPGTSAPSRYSFSVTYNSGDSEAGKSTIYQYDTTAKADSTIVLGTTNGLYLFGGTGDLTTTMTGPTVTYPVSGTDQLTFRTTATSGTPVRENLNTNRFYRRWVLVVATPVANESLEFEQARSYITFSESTSLSSKYTQQRILWRQPGVFYVTSELYYYANYSYDLKTKSDTIAIRIYDVPTPSIQIEEVRINPPGYSTIDPAPYDGKAPYQVKWKDTTFANHPYMIPQAQIEWNFGDPESGSDNVASQTNSGTSAITANPQTHVYSGYDSRTCEMTITDKAGNVTTGTARFSPSTKQRQFSDPTITKLYPTSGQTAPVIYKGETDLAGSPEPVPTWTYTLAGDSSYSGTVEGQYVEFSLLKGGTYTINYSVSLEGVQTTKSWTVTVDAPTDVPDDSLSMPDFALIVLDRNHVPVDWCKQHTSVQYIEYYQDNDVFSFQIPTNYPYAKYLQEGDYLVLGYNGKARLMQVTYRARTGSYITVSGESVFPDRVAITATRSQANDGYDTQKSTGEALIRYFVQSCLIDMYSDTPQPRGAPFVLFGTDAGRGGDQTYSARYESLRDIVKELSASSNLGYTVACRDISGLSAGMTITQGTDRTYSTGGSNMVIFSPERLRNCRIDSDMGGLSHNVAIGARDGDGFVREYGWYGDTAETGFDRRELFVDAGEIAGTDADKTAEVRRMALLELKQERQLSIRLFVMPTCQWAFGTDYQVGDIVTLEHPDRGTIDLQIYSAELCRRETGDELYLNLGYECNTAPSLIRKTAYDNTYARK